MTSVTIVCGLCERPEPLNFALPAGSLRSHPRAHLWADWPDLRCICRHCLAALIDQGREVVADPDP